MLNKLLLLGLSTCSSLIIIFSALVHPELINEQFGVISRERTCIYDYLILFSVLIMLISVIKFNMIKT